MTPEFIQTIIDKGEDYNRELKSARRSFSRDKDLPDYCAALANERGGFLILGVDNDKHVVGTTAFAGTHNRLAHYLFQCLHIRVNVHELILDGMRVLVFEVPSRNPGEIIRSTGNYHAPMRLGESLQEMDDRTMRDILNESLDDFSAIKSPAGVGDIDAAALESLVAKYAEKRELLAADVDTEQLRQDLRLVNGRKLTNTGLLLVGKQSAIESLLPQAEVILEWRQNPMAVNYDFRNSWRGPLVLTLDQIWEAIKVRNIRIPFQEGLQQREIAAFDERSVREAILNAITHRDYRITTDSVFIKASPESFMVISPGGFVPGINPDNALDESSWRNRNLAETLQQLGLVERSGQGLDEIYLRTIRAGKGQPALSEVAHRQVRLDIPAMVKDVEFIRFLERIADQENVSFTTRELIALEHIREHGYVREPHNKDKLLTLGIVERVGRGKGTRYILSERYYSYIDKKGVHTRLVGASRAAKKQLILDHIQRHSKVYNYELQDAFPDMTMRSISVLLRELSEERKIHHQGSKKYGYWVLNGN